MEEIDNTFVPRLNDFTEKLKEIQKIHDQHILNLKEQQQFLVEDIKDLRKDLKIESKRQELNNFKLEKYPPYTKLENKIHAFEKQVSIYRTIYKDYINDTNLLLGRISNHWSGYIEQVGVDYIMTVLRKECGAHTFYQKFKRYWHKTRNMDLDLVAISDTHAYIIEVKNQLRPDVVEQILATHNNIEKHVPEFEKLKKQAVVLCIHADEELLKTLSFANVWVLKYAGFDKKNQKNEWKWMLGSLKLSKPSTKPSIKPTAKPVTKPTAKPTTKPIKAKKAK